MRSTYVEKWQLNLQVLTFQEGPGKAEDREGRGGEGEGGAGREREDLLRSLLGVWDVTVCTSWQDRLLEEGEVGWGQ